MEISAFYKAYAQAEQSPIVICDINKKILFLNNYALNHYAAYKLDNIVGKSLNLFMTEEARSKLDMALEWFKEDKSNNRVFGYHDPSINTDGYIVALRDSEGDLIGFCGRHERRSVETCPKYDFKDGEKEEIPVRNPYDNKGIL